VPDPAVVLVEHRERATWTEQQFCVKPRWGDCGRSSTSQAGKTRDVRQLAHMSSDEVKPFVFATVRRLRENAR
jgi:hypothetical protein